MFITYYNLLLIAIINPLTYAYLPGLAPTLYCNKKGSEQNCQESVELFANRLNSDETVVPYEYKKYDFCPVTDSEKDPSENLGQVVFGERIEASGYKMNFGSNTSCVLKCTRNSNTLQLGFLKRGIRLRYQQHWIADNMPVLYCFMATDAQGKTTKQCTTGFPLGCYKTQNPKSNQISCPKEFMQGQNYLYNHLHFTVTYTTPKDIERTSLDQTIGRIVKVTVVPFSIKKFDKSMPYCGARNGGLIIPKQPDVTGTAKKINLTIQYSYSYDFKQDNTIKWASRWDYILNTIPKPKIQWLSIINSMVIVLFLSGMVAMIILRSIYRDIAKYNQMDNIEDAQEEFGWKLLHGDVFRAPRKGMLLSVFAGSGCQIFFMTLITLVLSCFGFLSPANRGAFTTTGLVLYVCLGTPAGFVAARIYKSFGGERWKFNVLCTSFLCPGLVFGMVFLLNVILWAKHSSAAIPFSTLLALLGLWFGISVPLTFIGAYFGFKKTVIEHPVRTNQIPRQIPVMSCYTLPLPGILMGGILPFGCIFIQLFFILTSIWSHHTYSMFGLLFLVYIIVTITCAEATVLLCYFHLCAEDYHWWWRSFLTSGMTAGYFFIYCVHFFFFKLEMHGTVSAILYFGYTIIITFLLFLLTGSIGFYSTFWFIRKIYGYVKVD